MAIRLVGLQRDGSLSGVGAVTKRSLLIITFCMTGEIEIEFRQTPVRLIVVRLRHRGLSQQHDALLQLLEILTLTIELIGPSNQRRRRLACAGRRGNGRRSPFARGGCDGDESNRDDDGARAHYQIDAAGLVVAKLLRLVLVSDNVEIEIKLV